MTKSEEINQIIDEIDILIANRCNALDEQFKEWYDCVYNFLCVNFGNDSNEVDTFSKVHFSNITPSTIFAAERSSVLHIEQEKFCKDGLEVARKILQKIQIKMTDAEKPKVLNKQLNNKKIFIVHGHDGELKEAVARIVEKQGIETIILSEQANQGKTIIEKFEDNSDVGAAICLFTKDDIGKANGGNEQPRARQNVVFEAGYFIGKLGRKHIIILADNGIEMPSDLSGIVYTNTTTDWQFELLKELIKMGYQIDANKLIK